MAERLPQVVLDGSFGYANATGAAPASLLASAAAGLFQPLLDWGFREAAVDIAEAAFREELLAFSESYLVAMEEVETTLWQEARQRERIAALAEREEILQRTIEESQVRYSLGVTDYLPVITALQDLQDVQRALLAARSDLVLLRVQLYRAVGGATVASSGSPEGAASAGELEIRSLERPPVAPVDGAEGAGGK
jgi:outer membrane protein TolC